MCSGDAASDAAVGPSAAAPVGDPAPASELRAPLRRRLLAIARESIAHGLDRGVPLPVDLAVLPTPLAEPRAAFVTLHRNGQLRGCIGHLEAVAPLACSVADNAFAAAFRDTRFPPLSPAELILVHIEISVLSPPEPIPCTSEAELLAALRPGIDGVILAEGSRRGTFLPAVWAQLPAPAAFLAALRAKAGLPAGAWSRQVQAWRYQTEQFDE